MLASKDIDLETVNTGCYWYGAGNPNICSSNNVAVPDAWC